MAFLDFLFGSPIKRHGKRVAERDAQAEDREESARWLANEGSDAAILALFGRYNLQIEHTLKDQREKDLVTDLLVELGPQATAQARVFASENVIFHGAVRVVERVEGAAAAVELLLALLARERVEEEFKIDKKKNLLIALAERRDPRIHDATVRFLSDFDEGVRNAAVEAVATQEGDAAREALGALLRNPEEESTRIRGRVAELFALRRWPAPDDPWLRDHMPSGFRHVDGRISRG